MLGTKARLKQQQMLSSTSNAISGAIDNMSRRIKDLENDIKAAQDGIAEYEESLRRLEARKKVRLGLAHQPPCHALQPRSDAPGAGAGEPHQGERRVDQRL